MPSPGLLQKQDFVFILLRPQFLGNIGSTARVMKNFGFDQLRLVNPPKNYLDAEARKMAVDAFDVLKKSRVFSSLEDALADVNIAVGSTCGQYRKHLLEDLAPLARSLFAELPKACRVGLVFGDERNGMTNDEIDRCHKLMRIESEASFASLNLSQALGIVAYQIAMQIGQEDVPDLAAPHAPNTPKILHHMPMDGETEKLLMDKLGQLMQDVEFSRSYNEAKLTAELRTSLQKCNLSQREGQIWHGLLSKLMARLTRQS
jgi:tRNA (cytidine32/uridine32-2'-O)-methyltransferase